jgi:cell division septation protein DedD
LQRRFAETAGKSAASDPPVPARPAPQTDQADTARPAAQTKQADTARPAAQTKQAKPAGPAAQATQTTQQTPPAKPAVRDEADKAPADEEWVVNIASSSREQAMVELAAKFRERGIPVERQTLTIEGDLMYRLRVAGFPSSEEARNYARRLDREFGLKGGWVSRK